MTPTTNPTGTTRYDLSRHDISELLGDVPRYRVDQIWAGLYDQCVDPDGWTSLPKQMRADLTARLPAALHRVTEAVSDDGDTIKYLWALHDDTNIETVLMLYPDRATVCVSSQAGCAMRCSFCATGQAGFTRHLSVGEIVEQVARARAAASSRDRRVSNVVFMGMGEPLANVEAVGLAVKRIHGELGISARSITVSTVGILPGIRALADWDVPVNLAVSLHAANDALRDRLVPINRRYPIDDLLAACAAYLRKRRRRVSFEWALIDGVNDRDQDATELADLAKRLSPRAHINLIPLNPTPGYPTTGSPPRRVQQFCGLLNRRGVNATVRNNRGTDIAAACGQLAAGQRVSIPLQRQQPGPTAGHISGVSNPTRPPTDTD